MDNSLSLSFHYRTKPAVVAKVRANALFIHAKLVSAGVSPAESKKAIEDLFDAGVLEGHEEGYDSGYDAGVSSYE